MTVMTMPAYIIRGGEAGRERLERLLRLRPRVPREVCGENLPGEDEGLVRGANRGGGAPPGGRDALNGR